MYLFLTFIVCLETVSSDLIFEDNFDRFNETKWQIFASDSTCSKLTPEQLSCSTNNRQNLMIISGTLALTAVQENFNENKFTSATIVSKEPISYNQLTERLTLVIRAALPTTNELQAQVLLIPNEDIYRRTTEGKLIIFQNIVNQIESGYFDDRGNKIVIDSFATIQDLSGFHTFNYKILSSELMGTIDGKRYFFGVKNRNCDCSIFGNDILSSYKLVISLQVNNKLADSDDKVIENAKNWNCTSFLIDWVKIYAQQPIDTDIVVLNNNNESPKKICTKINQSINRTSVTPTNQLTSGTSDFFVTTQLTTSTDNESISDHDHHIIHHKLFWIFPILLAVFIMALVITIVLLCRIKRKQSNKNTLPQIHIELPDIVTNMREMSIYSTCPNRLTVADENPYEVIPYPEYDEIAIERVQKFDKNS